MPTSSPSAARSARDDYFQNHASAVRWPFTLYHRPIEASLARSVRASLSSTDRPRAMVFGCGLFHEAPLFEAVPELLLVDVDRRLAPELERRLSHRAGVDMAFPADVRELAEVVAPESVDLIVAKEVIEHLDDAEEYLRVFRERLRPGGELWLSTPNYGAPVLPFLEATFLEAVARLQGFSRKHIHPNKYSRARLERQLREAGFAAVEVEDTPLKLALCARGRRR